MRCNLTEIFMKQIAVRIFPILLFMVYISLPVTAQWKYEPSAENLKSREWFKAARFGLFIHWGVYSIPGDGEWVMNIQQIPIATYEKLPAFFNPTEFDP